ncbi:hypothetical protein FRC12_014910 [Ceratobasidium sp. 428]|nr:hypothetical protein FRC12_014910 [Ceratobasidium sp. 428]
MPSLDRSLSTRAGEQIAKQAEVDLPAGQRTLSKYFAGEVVPSATSSEVGRTIAFRAAGEDIGDTLLEEWKPKGKGFEKCSRNQAASDETPKDVLDIVLFEKANDFPSEDESKDSPMLSTSSGVVIRRKVGEGVNSRTSGAGRKRKPEQTLEPQLSGERSEESVESASPKPKPRKRRAKRGYAPPETYAHLNFVQDCLDYELNILFCGINPGQMSAGEGHHFANPRNGFWKCLHQGGLTDTLIPPSEDHTLPERFKLGITNLVDRPSAEMGELSVAERRAGVPLFLRKISKWRPRIVCMVGKGIWEDVFTYVAKTAKGKSSVDGILVQEGEGGANLKLKDGFEFDIQPVCLLHGSNKGVERTLFFVVPSTSGRVLTHQLADKIELFKLLNKRWSELQNGTMDKRMELEIRVDPSTT